MPARLPSLIDAQPKGYTTTISFNLVMEKKNLTLFLLHRKKRKKEEKKRKKKKKKRKEDMMFAAVILDNP